MRGIVSYELVARSCPRCHEEEEMIIFDSCGKERESEILFKASIEGLGGSGSAEEGRRYGGGVA